MLNLAPIAHVFAENENINENGGGKTGELFTPNHIVRLPPKLQAVTRRGLAWEATIEEAESPQTSYAPECANRKESKTRIRFVILLYVDAAVKYECKPCLPGIWQPENTGPNAWRN